MERLRSGNWDSKQQNIILLEFEVKTVDNLQNKNVQYLCVRQYSHIIQKYQNDRINWYGTEDEDKVW